jgi:hypothetical protein
MASTRITGNLKIDRRAFNRQNFGSRPVLASATQEAQPSRCRLPLRDLVSAKGAAFISQPGAVPQGFKSPRKKRRKRVPIWRVEHQPRCDRINRQRIESRFQR